MPCQGTQLRKLDSDRVCTAPCTALHGCSSETLQQDLKLNKDDDLRPGLAAPNAIELGAHGLPKTVDTVGAAPRTAMPRSWIQSVQCGPWRRLPARKLHHLRCSSWPTYCARNAERVKKLQQARTESCNVQTELLHNMCTSLVTCWPSAVTVHLLLKLPRRAAAAACCRLGTCPSCLASLENTKKSKVPCPSLGKIAARTVRSG